MFHISVKILMPAQAIKQARRRVKLALALISLYTPVVIIVVAVVAVLFSFFWVFLPPPC